MTICLYIEIKKYINDYSKTAHKYENTYSKFRRFTRGSKLKTIINNQLNARDVYDCHDHHDEIEHYYNDMAIK